MLQMRNSLYDHQKDALKGLKTGSILCGGVGSGKSLTALAYYYTKECEGSLETEDTELSAMVKPKDLYIITTAKKRDALEWDKECADFMLSRNNREDSVSGVLLIIDSWNNLSKYSEVKNAFFIFDEQRVIGSGAWVKHFLKITKSNPWILLTATPGDTWSDYIPIFIANGFYKNRSEFVRRHVVYSRFTRFPKIDRYIETNHLLKLKEEILILMNYEKKTRSHTLVITCAFNLEKFNIAFKKRWDPFKNAPIRDAGALCYILRKVVNSDPSRIEQIHKIFNVHKKIIIFYNFNYELEILRTLNNFVTVSEYNGHKHEAIPNTKSWAYLVQYTSGAEGWNCIETNAIVFYSQNYSYKTMVQAAGRIDRLNTLYTDLFYYHLRSESNIDLAIAKALKNKKSFNERSFERSIYENPRANRKPKIYS